MSAPVEVPQDIVERVRALCLALPEVTVRVDYSLTEARSTAWSFDIRRRSFCLLVAWQDPAGQAVPLLVLRAGPQEREALLAVGHPFFAPRAGRGRIGVLLTGDTDWAEIGELVIESYRVLAPKKLTALLDDPGRLRQRLLGLGAVHVGPEDQRGTGLPKAVVSRSDLSGSKVTLPTVDLPAMLFTVSAAGRPGIVPGTRSRTACWPSPRSLTWCRSASRRAS